MTWPHPLTHWPTQPPTHPPMGGWVNGWGISTNHKSSNRIELPRLGQDWLNFYSFDLTPPIDPPIHPTIHTHPWVGVSLQIINLQTELNYLDSVNNFQIFSYLTWLHPSTHPPTHQTIHPPMGGGVSTDFKSSNGIEISWLVQVLLNFEWFRGSPPWGWGVGGLGWWVVRGCTPPMCTHTCTHACACTHTHVWHHREFPGIPPMGAAFCMKLSCLPCMRVHVCMCMHAHACAHVWGTPNHPPPPSTHTPNHPPPHPPTPPTPELQGAQNTKPQ